jgi:hypothetical protein
VYEWGGERGAVCCVWGKGTSQPVTEVLCLILVCDILGLYLLEKMKSQQGLNRR